MPALLDEAFVDRDPLATRSVMMLKIQRRWKWALGLSLVCIFISSCSNRELEGQLIVCVDEVSSFESNGSSYWVDQSPARDQIVHRYLYELDNNCFGAVVRMKGDVQYVGNFGHGPDYDRQITPEWIRIIRITSDTIPKRSSDKAK